MTTKPPALAEISDTPSDAVVLLTNAGCDAGCRRARELLSRGHRVVVTARHTSRLTRILLNQNPNQVWAIAADLSESTKTLFPGEGDSTKAHLTRNIRFGVREHGMGAAVNGMAGHGGMLRFAARPWSEGAADGLGRAGTDGRRVA